MDRKNRKINLGGREITYCLKTGARAKNLRIAVKSGGEVFVTKPRFMPEFLARNFLAQKSEWILDKIAKAENRKKLLAQGTREDFLRIAPNARALVLKKIGELNRVYNFDFGRVAIRNQKTRWGSCSQAGNLNFNYRIAILPDRLADYIVAHELCHLREMNHSQKFWNLVAVAIPDYAICRRELKKY
jgi:predicted metal-dependent hydrolase